MVMFVALSAGPRVLVRVLPAVGMQVLCALAPLNECFVLGRGNSRQFLQEKPAIDLRHVGYVPV